MASSQLLVLITGANQGVGFETAKNLLLSSEIYHVLIGSRDKSKGAQAVSNLQTFPIKGTVASVHIDVTDDASVDTAAEHVSQVYGRLDVLVNNAGIFSKNPVRRQAFRETLEVNCVGAISVSEAFLPLLRRSSVARLIFVGSSTGSITHQSGPEHGDGAVLNLLGTEGIKVFSADPGLVVSNLVDTENQRARGGVGGHVGGERIARVVKGERDADVGKVCGEYGVSLW